LPMKHLFHTAHGSLTCYKIIRHVPTSLLLLRRKPCCVYLSPFKTHSPHLAPRSCTNSSCTSSPPLHGHGVLCGFFYCCYFKIHCPWPGLNRRSLGPMPITLTTRPPKTTCCHHGNLSKLRAEV
jgi:hypothetical protein